MESIQTKIFYFIGSADSPVINVGMRPSVIHHGSGIHGLKIVAHNIPAIDPKDVDRVEIIVRGEVKQILSFYNYVKSVDIRRHLLKDGVKPKVSELSTYAGEEPDWTYCIMSTTHEQFYAAFDVLKQLGDNVAGLMKMIVVNRKEDRAWIESNRKEDRAWIESNRREDREREESNRREDREREESNRREDREREESNRREDREREESNRREDRAWMTKNIEATNKLHDKLITNQNEILLDVKTIKKTLERMRN